MISEINVHVMYMQTIEILFCHNKEGAEPSGVFISLGCPQLIYSWFNIIAWNPSEFFTSGFRVEVAYH